MESRGLSQDGRDPKPKQHQPWFPNRFSLEKLPFIQAFAPLGGVNSTIPALFYDDLLSEHMACLAIKDLERSGNLFAEARAKEVEAIDDATKSISKQYRNVAISIHPDRFGDKYVSNFNELQHAYDVLRNEEHRRYYFDSLLSVCECRINNSAGFSFSQKVVVDSHRGWIEKNRKKFQTNQPVIQKTYMATADPVRLVLLHT